MPVVYLSREVRSFGTTCIDRVMGTGGLFTLGALCCWATNGVSNCEDWKFYPSNVQEGGGQMDPSIGFSDLKFEAFEQSK